MDKPLQQQSGGADTTADLESGGADTTADLESGGADTTADPKEESEFAQYMKESSKQIAELKEALEKREKDSSSRGKRVEKVKPQKQEMDVFHSHFIEKEAELNAAAAKERAEQRADDRESRIKCMN